MTITTRRLAAGAALLAILLAAWAAAAPNAEAQQTRKKTIWGPTEVNGVSQFPIYRDLGAGLFHTKVDWAVVARNRPENPTDPNDPAYAWPEHVDFAVREAPRYGMRVVILVQRTPQWANGRDDSRYAPRRVRDYTDFLVAAQRRYRGVRHWMIWGEPSRRQNWMPLATETRRLAPLTRRQGEGVRRYARLLDASYGRLKGMNRRNLIIGGNSFTAGDISPLNWVRNLRLPNGEPPRMDLYGHNPFTRRRPVFSRQPLGQGFADFSDLTRLRRWVAGHLQRSRRKPIPLFLSEFVLATDHPNHEFNFWVTREIQASWLKSALRRTRESSWIYSFGWFSLYDDPARRDGLEVNRGLLDVNGARKPSYEAYKRG